jgi:hypothetical protein
MSVDWALVQLSENFIQTSELQNKPLLAMDIQYLKLDLRSGTVIVIKALHKSTKVMVHSVYLLTNLQ